MNEPIAFWTLLIIAVTCGVSFLAFKNSSIEEKYIFCPRYILAGKQYYRLFTSAFLHGGGSHLLFNMISLFLFGQQIELWYGWGYFLTIYVASIIGGSLLSLWLHRHHDYKAYGASGGVAGLIFSYIFLFPGSSIGYAFIPIPAWLYAIVYMVGSIIALKRQKDNVGHDAHLGGAIIGLLTTTALFPRVAHDSPILFATLLIISVLLFLYLARNPLFLPMSNVRDFLPSLSARKTKISALPAYKRENLELDSILEKISKSGIQALTEEEHAFLKNVSQKYQNRSSSQGKESDLVI